MRLNEVTKAGTFIFLNKETIICEELTKGLGLGQQINEEATKLV